MVPKINIINEKVCVNDVEITDIESWKKVIDSITELQQENQQLKEELKCSIRLVEHNRSIQNHTLKERALQTQIIAREEDYRKLENNWNTLKEYVNNTKLKEFEKSFGKRYGKVFTQAEIIVCNMILSKIKELEM